MKLSNKILVAFFGFIFLYLSAAFAELRLTGTPTVYDEKNGIVETVELPVITYVVLAGLDQSIEVSSSEKPSFEIRSLSGDLLKKIKYQISNDTLTISDLPEEKRTSVKIKLFVPRTGFKGMTVNNSVVIVKGLRQEQLRLSENAGRIWMSESNIGKIQIVASSQSSLDISETRLDTLSVELQSSDIHLSSQIKLLTGSMKHNSALYLGDVNEIQFKKDGSSKMYQ